MEYARKELSPEELGKVTGGAWTFDTLTQQELDFYNALQEAWEEAEIMHEWDKQKDIEIQINAFIDRMDVKYNA